MNIHKISGICALMSAIAPCIDLLAVFDLAVKKHYIE